MTDTSPPGDEKPTATGGLKGIHFILIAVAALIVAAVFYLISLRKERGEPSAPPSGGVAVVPEGTRAVTLFFAGEGSEGLLSETREVAIGTDFVEQLKQVMRALLDGPTHSGINAIPEHTKLLNAFYDSETATVYLDFSSELVAGHPGGSSAEYCTIAAIVRTISENFPEVRGVQLLVEGLQVGTIGGHIDAYRPFLVRDWR